ncbi:energy-coupling factor transporter transmembrane component T [Cereibacter changlensis]|uniref:ABC transporter permease n=2 Tax=Cereibacter changlensis TaxID=402884 RepID=A0A2T4JYR6_9RHOB|nr:energy-coupling factor transporter transmembrane component T [Cereibacter changlensis]PTE22903.1 ABC transporter permease [Cereibacter changlensis JA139]PZX55271.1 biotin transport system permease protein [Cereibacter changlensis]
MLTLTSPVETRLHRLPAGLKLALLALAAIGLALLPLGGLVLAAAAVVALYLAQGTVFAAHGLRMLRPLWPFLLVLLVWHVFTADLPRGLEVALRLLTAVALANLVTMTTRLEDLISVVERLAAPLARFGLSPRVLAVSIALVIRFVPVFLLRVNQLAEAWRARSRGRANWRIVVPVALTALDDADHVAEALRARGGL